ncbi:MAG: STAS/SEC14 domain-containing protein [Myxococcales bacterium FL481]|nr:MAG: STAS/SEC14 domain-containing protein [Myxococcales bacterium FL481]
MLSPPNSAKSISTRTSINWISNGIIYSSNQGTELIDLEEAERISAAFAELSPEGAPLLVDLGNPKGQTREARVFFSSSPDHLARYSAVALLVTNPIAKVLANFYLGLNRPPKPTRLFTSVPAAEAWLKTFIQGQGLAA